MISGHRKLLLTAALVLTLSGGVIGSSPFSAPSIDGAPTAQAPLNITVNNDTAVSDPLLRYKKHSSVTWKTCDLAHNGILTCELPDGLEQGAYEYYLINGTNDSTRFPTSGTLSLSVSQGIKAWQEKARAFTDTNPRNDGFSASCSPWNNDFSCAFEHMQGYMVQMFARAAHTEDNVTYTDKTGNLSLREYDETGSSKGTERWATCDIDNSDYSCQNTTGNEPNPEADFIPDGARRQARLIHDLATAGMLLRNDTLVQEAVTYGIGSAEGCDIWSGDYDCPGREQQGLMTSAYWRLYRTTGNATFRQKADKLAEETTKTANSIIGRTNITRPPFHILKALWDSYEWTGNTTYRDRAENLSLRAGSMCVNRTGNSSCAPGNQTASIKAHVSGFRTTGETYYLHLAHEALKTGFNGTCDPWSGDYTCDRADEQGRLGSVFWTAYRSLPAGDARFSTPRVIGTRQSGNALEFNVDIVSNLTDPALQIKKIESSGWTTCDLFHRNTTCTISGGFLTEQTIYEYRFNASSTTLPTKGSFKLLMAHRNETLEDKAINVTTGSPEFFCDVWTDDYSCRFTDYQGWMIQGMYESFTQSENTTYGDHLRLLGMSEYDQTNVNSVCDHDENDFDCETDRQPGSVVQGRIIESLWDAYRQTDNKTIRELAHNYTFGTAEDCDVWSGDYQCNTRTGQAAMLSGYLAAYASTGNHSHLNTARELAWDSRSFNTTAGMLRGWWRLYGYTSNTTFQSMAENETLSVLELCKEGNCSVINYSNSFTAGIESYLQTGNSTYYNKSYNVFRSGNNGSCDIWGGNYSCQDADEQGALMEATWTAYSSDKIQLDGSVSINTTEDSVIIGNSLNTTCSVTNTVANGTELLDVNLSISAPGFNVTGNKSEEFTSIEALESKNTSWKLESSQTGEHSLTCKADASNGWFSTVEKTVTVEKKPEEGDSGGDSDSDSSGGGGGGGNIGGTPPPRTETSTFDLEHQDSLSDLLDVMSSFSQFNSSVAGLLDTEWNGVLESATFTADHASCFSGSRNFTEDGNHIWTTLNYSCGTYLERLLLRDAVPSGFGGFENLTVSSEGRVIVLQSNPAMLIHQFRNITENELIRIRYEADQAGNFSAFDAPFLLIKNHTLPPPDQEAPEIAIEGIVSSNVTNKSLTFTPMVSDTSTVTCHIRRNGSTEAIEPDETLDVNLTEGWNRFDIGCSDEAGNSASETVNIYRQPEKKESPLFNTPDISISVLAGIASILLGAGGILFGYRRREMFYDFLQERKMQFKLWQLEKRFEEEDFVAVIKLYEEIKNIYEQRYGRPPEMEFWHEHIGDFGMILRIYLLMDMAVKRVEQGNGERVISTIDNLQGLYKRFKGRNPSKELRKQMEKKARRLDRVLKDNTDAVGFNY